MKFSHVRPDPYSGLKTGLFCFVYLLVIVVCLFWFLKHLKSLESVRQVSLKGFIIRGNLTLHMSQQYLYRGI